LNFLAVCGDKSFKMQIALSAEFRIISDIYMSLIIPEVQTGAALNIYIVQCLRCLLLTKGRLFCKDAEFGAKVSVIQKKPLRDKKHSAAMALFNILSNAAHRRNLPPPAALRAYTNLHVARTRHKST
jgi:hypothetical protein